MKGDAIKSVMLEKLAGNEPTDERIAEAVTEAVDIVLGFFVNVERIAAALQVDEINGFDASPTN